MSVFPAIMPTYQRSDIAFERGEGAYLHATDGRRFLDFACGIAVTGLGHAHPHLVAALTEQAQKLWHCSNIFTIPGQQRLAERLVANSFADTVFFANSGAEAVECGIKAIRRYHYVDGNPQKNRIICMTGGFHGRTLATVYAGGQAKHTEGLDPRVEGFDHVAYGNLNELRAAVGDETGGILVEPIQGEGGYRPAPEGYLEGVREIADEYGLLVMLDEVQCGNGRSGELWAYQLTDMEPDIMATAKGMGGGFPVGACLATEEASKGMTAGTHGSTYGGNPLAMAVGNAVLDVLLEPGFLDRVKDVSVDFRAALDKLVEAHPEVFVEARGVGLMQGLKLAEHLPNRDFVAMLREAGLLTVAAGDNVVRLAPPLIIERSHIDEAAGLIGAVAATAGRAAKGEARSA